MDLMHFVPQEVRLIIPNAQRINRGGQVLSEVVEACRSHDFTDIVMLHEHRGEPGAGFHFSMAVSVMITCLIIAHLYLIVLPTPEPRLPATHLQMGW